VWLNMGSRIILEQIEHRQRSDNEGNRLCVAGFAEAWCHGHTARLAIA